MATMTAVMELGVAIRLADHEQWTGVIVHARHVIVGTDTELRVGVIRIGGLGALTVQFLKAFGHQVVAIDNRQEGLDLSTELPLKADLVVHRDSETAVQEVMRLSENKGLAAVVIFSVCRRTR
ncbi:uncharacterized protein ASPGLDRAFT_40027 [Aspergillus glaucus CBS 516.65]|uniref:RCK N-terminal domain-containing protein n=1 Tax=Aspergillus glaucus CBS 516.65 TaxID=1160497 RepID=A0A1L9V5Z5_ASPGL|nr:hypothetical protein ASPGLDRAFT_40027 [Aspergillus glaucus CBS 516.65]OJJ79328.1 hypothetical protein ASPGLDRAFT_40027 [Aspergillus glaucus CBS 516.65]